MLLGILLLLSLPIYYVFYIKRNKRKKRKITINPDYNSNNDPEQLIKNRYARSKIPQDIDTIIIGSGIGGLSTASLLAQSGKKVLVLEQHYLAGGCTHSFADKGTEHETGIHYVGSMEK